MESIKAWLDERFARITGSIAFWPGLIAAGFMVLAIVLRSLGQEVLGPTADKVVPFLLIQDGDVALGLLTMITGGLISLMVFSFSMVMVLLSNATSNLSPRLLPSLIGSKNHQMVLGLYLGTIMFNIIVAMGFQLSGAKDDLPSVAVATAVILGIVCLAMFVAFIHNVSRSIQVGVVLKDVHARTIQAIVGVIRRNEATENSSPFPHYHQPIFMSPQAGFFQGVDAEALASFARRTDSLFYVDTIRGNHVLKGDPICVISCKEESQEFQKEVVNFMKFNSREDTSEYFAHGIERIVEVALKALSPGINDPGTALTSIDYLKDIFDTAIPLNEWEIVCDQDGMPRIWLRLEKWEDLLKRHVLSIYAYGKEDYSVSKRLDMLLKALENRVPNSDTKRHTVIKELMKQLQ